MLWLFDYIDSVKQIKMRNTQQKEAIKEVFCSNDQPLCVKEILQLTQEIISSTNIATVYRNVNQLLKTGWLVKIEFPPLGTYYERAGKSHHHFFYCRKCKSIFVIPGCPLDLPGAVPSGFVHEEHDLFLRGVCESCCKKKTKG